MNVAMDLVINQISDLERVITSITEEDPTTGEKRFLGVSIPSMKQEFDLDVPRNQTSLFYYNMLLKESEKNQKLRDMITEYQFVHDFGDDMPEALKELLIKNAIAKAKQATGRLSGGYEELVNQLLSSKVDWRKHINNFISNSVEVTHTQSRTKRNRRYGILYPGKSVEPKRSIAYIEDTSGSMSIEQISQGRAELVKIQKLYPDFTIYLIQADSEVKDAIELKKAPPPTVKGRGGTAYQPAIDKAVELGCDSIVYYGDMDCADIPNDPKIPVLWAVTGGQKPPVTWGKYVRVE
jgi:predicted metal-dependent peptidase